MNILLNGKGHIVETCVIKLNYINIHIFLSLSHSLC